MFESISECDLKQIIDKIESEILHFLNENLFFELFSVKYLDASFSLKSHLLTPLLDITSRGGKRLRPVFLILLTRLFLGDEKAAYSYAPVIEAIHTASLVHDDIEDGSVKRRGESALHIKYGIDTALNAASYLYFFALSLIEKQDKDRKASLYKETTESLTLLHLGQAFDIRHHSNYDLPFTYKDYTTCVALKTGELFSLAAKAALIFSGKACEKREEPALFSELGIAFQMFDDLQNISSGNKGKDRGDDIVEGKLSFPIVLYLEERISEKTKIISLFKRAKEEGILSSAVNECCKLLEKNGILEKGLEIAKKKADTVFDKLYSLHKNSFELDVIKELFFKSTAFKNNSIK